MTKHDIIIIGADPWEHYTWRRRHHVAWNLAKENRVLFIEPPLTLLQPFRDIDLSWRHLLRLGRLKHQGRNLYSYSPVRLLPLALPGSRHFNYYERDKKRIFTRVAKIVKKMEFKKPILWIYYYNSQYDYIGLFDEKIIVTDVYDKFAAFSGITEPDDNKEKTKKREKQLLENTDIVFAVSEELKKYIRKFGKDAIVISQGVDYEKYENILLPSKKERRRVEQIPQPRLGFIGIMHYIVDFELLAQVADSRKDWSIVLMGKKWLNNEKDATHFNSLCKRNNVYYLGEIPKEKLPYYLSKLNVGLMPMKKNELNRSASPLKLWEYLAAGKPVVAIDQRVQYNCMEFVKIASSPEEFISLIEESLADRRNGQIEKMRIIAKNHSWKHRTHEMMEVIESHL